MNQNKSNSFVLIFEKTRTQRFLACVNFRMKRIINKVRVFLLSDCFEPLGMEDGRIFDQEITASSKREDGWEASEGRLNNINDASSSGAWAPKTQDMGENKLQIK